MRVFGEIKGIVPEKSSFPAQQAISPFKLKNNCLEIEYEGPYIDIEQLLDDILPGLDENAHGYVDCIDHENWEVTRFSIDQGVLSCKKVNPDNALEAYKL
ncbi:MAG: hypothetical protein ACLFP9_00360 [Desulfonatronovibrio sp.]